MRLPPLNPLRAFEAAARHGSVTRAAAELRVTHGAVSHQIRALEDALRVRLFRRERGRLVLSAQAAALLPAITTAFDGISNAVARVSGVPSEGDLVVNCVPALMSFWLIPNLKQFIERYPGVRLRLTPANDPAEALSGSVDLAVCYGDGAWPNLWVRFLAPVTLFPVCSPALLNNRPLRTLDDLSDHVLLHADEGFEWNNWLGACDALRLVAGRHHFLSDAHLAIEAAVHGAGIALGDAITASQSLASGRLVAPFPMSVTARHSFYVVCREEVRATQLAHAFIEWLSDAIVLTERTR